MNPYLLSYSKLKIFLACSLACLFRPLGPITTTQTLSNYLPCFLTPNSCLSQHEAPSHIQCLHNFKFSLVDKAIYNTLWVLANHCVGCHFGSRVHCYSPRMEHNCIHIRIHTSQNTHSKRCTQTARPGLSSTYINSVNRQREQDFLPRLTVLRKFAGLWCSALPNLVQCPQFKRFSLKMLRCKARASTVSAILCTMAICGAFSSHRSILSFCPVTFHFLHIDLVSISTWNLFCEVSPESLL